MKKVRIAEICEEVYKEFGYVDFEYLGKGITDWEEVSDEDHKIISDFFKKKLYTGKPTRVLITLQDKEEVAKTLKEVIEQAKKEEAKRIEKEKKRKAAAEKRAKTRAENKRKRDLAKLEKLKKELGEE